MFSSIFTKGNNFSFKMMYAGTPLSHRDGSNKGSQQMFSLGNKKNSLNYQKKTLLSGALFYFMFVSLDSITLPKGVYGSTIKGTYI